MSSGFDGPSLHVGVVTKTTPFSTNGPGKDGSGLDDEVTGDNGSSAEVGGGDAIRRQD